MAEGLACLDDIGQKEWRKAMSDVGKADLKCFDDPKDTNACAYGDPSTKTIYFNTAKPGTCQYAPVLSVMFHELLHLSDDHDETHDGLHYLGYDDPVDRVLTCQKACYPDVNDGNVMLQNCMACNAQSAATHDRCFDRACKRMGCHAGCFECAGKMICADGGWTCKKCDGKEQAISPGKDCERVCFECPCDPEGKSPPGGPILYGTYDECAPKCVKRTLSCWGLTYCDARPCK